MDSTRDTVLEKIDKKHVHRSFLVLRTTSTTATITTINHIGGTRCLYNIYLRAINELSECIQTLRVSFNTVQEQTYTFSVSMKIIYDPYVSGSLYGNLEIEIVWTTRFRNVDLNIRYPDLCLIEMY